MLIANWAGRMEKNDLGRGISLLVPLHLGSQDDRRAENWKWLEEYWTVNLLGSEIVVGTDYEAKRNKIPFSKSVAVNDAARKAQGDIFAIVDADAYVSVETVLRAAREIRLAQKMGYKLWLMPYRRLFRLTEKASGRVLKSDSECPLKISSPSREGDFISTANFRGTVAAKFGHGYGAMIQIVPRQAFEIVGGWDPRFRGWGGEDYAAMAATDTLYSPHKTLPDQILHLWHPVTGFQNPEDAVGKKRFWENQTGTNSILSSRYYQANGHPKRMRRLVDEFKNGKSGHGRPTKCPTPVSS